MQLTTLETRRYRGDLIEVLKIFEGFDNLDIVCLLIRIGQSTIGHSLKLVKPTCRIDRRRFSFAHRIVDNWNGLDESIIACDSWFYKQK